MGAHPTLPDEGVTAGRFGWVGALLGALVSTVYILVASSTVDSMAVALAGIGACLVAAAAFALADWERLPQPARLAPVVSGLALTVVAVENTGGTTRCTACSSPSAGWAPATSPPAASCRGSSF
jgi:TctA family transporter